MKEICVSELPQQRLLTLLPQLDEALGGGLLFGQIVTIQGRSGVGKNTLAAFIAKCAQQQFGMECIFVPAEGRSFNNPKFYTRCGIYNSLSRVVRPENGEDILGVSFLKSIEEKVKSNEPRIIVLDSVQSLITQGEATEGISSNEIGKQAALIGKFAKLMTPLLEINGSILIILKQERANLSMGKAASPQGGLQLEHCASTEIKLFYGPDIKIDDEIVGFKVKVVIEKSPLSKPTFYAKDGGLEIAQFWSNGFDFDYNLVSHACVLGIIESGGAGWHTLPKAEGLEWPEEELKIQSRYAVIEEIKKHPEYSSWLLSECDKFRSIPIEKPEKKKKSKKDKE